MNTVNDRITELNQNYNDLGEDLLLIESVIIASQGENPFPADYIASSLCRVMEYTEQHLGDIQHLAQSLSEEALRRREYPKQYGRDRQ